MADGITPRSFFFFFFCLAGARQIDGAIGSFSALEKITASSRVRRGQEQGKFTVLFDSGIRTGSDVIKAIAMGAQGVLGEQGVLPRMFKF